MPEPTSRRRAPEHPPLVLALHLEPATIHAALVNESGYFIALRSKNIKPISVNATVAAIGQLILELSDTAERETSEIKALGISVDGIVDQLAERVTFNHQTGFAWERVPLKTMIEETLLDSGVDLRFARHASPARAAKNESSHPHIIVAAHRHVHVCAEAWRGAGTGLSNVVLLSLGLNHAAAGIMAHGKIISGVGDLAGSIANFSMSKDADVTLATEANASALVRKTLEKWTLKTDSALSLLARTDPSQLTAATILRAARSNDPLALEAVQEICAVIGRTAANIIALLNCEAVIIGGEFGQMLKPFISTIRQAAKESAPPAAMKQCQIVSAKLKENLELLGAAKLAWNSVT
jgi:predicted NBD/HSP70 family sugar kinase